MFAEKWISSRSDQGRGKGKAEPQTVSDYVDCLTELHRLQGALLDGLGKKVAAKQKKKQ